MFGCKRAGSHVPLVIFVSRSFSDELPARFKKHVIKAVQSDGKEEIQIDSLNTILENIGRPDACLSVEDQELVLKEAGVSSRSIPVSKMWQMME